MSGTRISNLFGGFTVLVDICCLVIGGFAVDTALALSGLGTEEDPWRIQSLADFNEFAADANYWDDYTRLMTDVDLGGRIYSEAVIAPDVNNFKDGFQGTAFTGVFDGNGYEIINLTINGGSTDYLGLFGYVNEGEVGNLGIEGGSFRGNIAVGSLAGGNLYGIISNCYSTASVSGGDNSGLIGGLLGFSYAGIVSNCYSTGDVDGFEEVGGLVGDNFYGSFSNCYSTGDVNGVWYVGGLVGVNYDNVSNCYSTGDVSGLGFVGGLMGRNGDIISDCFWDTDTQTHGVTTSIGENLGTATNVAGLTTTQMQTKSNFTDAGWDFVNIWDICEGTNYPRLLWQIPMVDFFCPNGIDFFDFSFFAGYWQEGNCGASNDCDGTDLDLSGTVEINDLRIFVDNWLRDF
ncbi:MAG: hypothetical protein GWN67_21275 [Phycisphaerae bacterium]|nr:hypothetical protein [Phycisphaerae bacterium]NIR67770.1 hypothetical protein [candidate division Zixibacteria bacterium]NIP51763.1 hypothetical protein [Phycisphaerae bacterium]NIS53460.1 hypothetical protein [Phycisphaerae bacterium]NIU10942.1 hypothetical protein [Phycisphaerae bacterium]